MAIEGSCVCGAVHFTIAPPYITYQYCHCSRCRKMTGSAHAANLFVAPEHFAWTAGEGQIRRFELPTAKYWSSTFCTTCGSTLPWLTRTGKAWIVPAGSLDADPGALPQRNIMVASGVPWCPSTSDLPSFDAYPPK